MKLSFSVSMHDKEAVTSEMDASKDLVRLTTGALFLLNFRKNRLLSIGKTGLKFDIEISKGVFHDRQDKIQQKAMLQKLGQKDGQIK